MRSSIIDGRMAKGCGEDSTRAKCIQFGDCKMLQFGVENLFFKAVDEVDEVYPLLRADTGVCMRGEEREIIAPMFFRIYVLRNIYE